MSKIRYSELETIHKSPKGEQRFIAANGHSMEREGDTVYIQTKRSKWCLPWTGVKWAVPEARRTRATRPKVDPVTEPLTKPEASTSGV